MRPLAILPLLAIPVAVQERDVILMGRTQLLAGAAVAAATPQK